MSYLDIDHDLLPLSFPNLDHEPNVEVMACDIMQNLKTKINSFKTLLAPQFVLCYVGQKSEGW
jgi:hypothetical protein